MRTEEMELFEEEERIEGEKETGRLEAFCDAVFAIAMPSWTYANERKSRRMR